MAQEMILAKLSQLQEFGEKFIAKISDVSSRVKTLEAVGAQANLIERILVNGDPLSVGENKTVNIPVPTRVNQLENDASYQENVIERIQVNGVTQGITGKTVNVHMPTAVSELTNDENYQTNVRNGPDGRRGKERECQRTDESFPADQRQDLSDQNGSGEHRQDGRGGEQAHQLPESEQCTCSGGRQRGHHVPRDELRDETL